MLLSTMERIPDLLMSSGPQAHLRRWDHQDLDVGTNNAHDGAALHERHVTDEPVMQAAPQRAHWYSTKATSSKRRTTSGPRPTLEAQGVSARDAQCTPHIAGSTRRPSASGNEVDAEALHPAPEATTPRCSSSGAHSSSPAHTAGGARKASARR